MKSQHRHELQTNELGKVADKLVGNLGGVFDTYGNRILIGLCVAMVVAAIVIYKVRRESSNEAAAWRDLDNARNAEDYAGVSERHPGSAAGRWARLHEGETRLTEGVQLMFTSVESGTKELKLAREALQEIVDQKGALPEMRERALFALARCLESLSDGTESDAVKSYQALLREFPATIYKKDAEGRIEALNSGSGQDFYAWFSRYDRPKPSEKRPRDRRVDDEPGLTDPSALDDSDKSVDLTDTAAESDEAPKQDDAKKESGDGPAAGDANAPSETAPASEAKPDQPESKPQAP